MLAALLVLGGGGFFAYRRVRARQISSGLTSPPDIEAGPELFSAPIAVAAGEEGEELSAAEEQAAEEEQAADTASTDRVQGEAVAGDDSGDAL